MRDVTDSDLALARRVVRGLCLDHAEVDDAIGDAFEGVAIAASSYDPTRGPWPQYVVLVVKRTVIEAHRRRFGRRRGASELSRVYVDHDEKAPRSRPAVVPIPAEELERRVDPSDGEAAVMRDAVVQQVRRALAHLTPYDQEVAAASITDGGQRALAAARGVTESAISQRRRVVHDRLRRMLQDVA